MTCLVTMFDPKLQVFKMTIFDELFQQNVNVAFFAHNIEWDFFVMFKHRV